MPLILPDERKFHSPMREEFLSPLQHLNSNIVPLSVSPVLAESMPYQPGSDDERGYDRKEHSELERDKEKDKDQPIILAGDDILPAFVCVLIKVCPKHLHTISFYVDNFLFFDISSTPLGYIHVSFKAAVEFITRTYNSLPEEKKRTVDEAMLEDEEEEEELFHCEASSPFPRQRKASVPPPLMSMPSATTKPSPLPGANAKSFSGTPEICVGEDPRRSTELKSFLKSHKRINQIN